MNARNKLALFRVKPPHSGPGGGSASDEIRSELKFDFENSDEEKVRSTIGLSCRRVVHARPVSRVMSLYFDDPALGDCARSMDGAGDRAKVRLRWYDSPFPARRCWFEIKRRHHGVMSKRRIELECAADFAELSHAAIHEGLTAALPAEAALWLVARPIPTMLIGYDREHFVDAVSGIRLTLDRNLISWPQTGALRPAVRFGAPVPDRFILEAKGEPGHMEALPALLDPLRPRVSRYSKYVTSCQGAGLFMGAGAAISG